MTDQQTAAYRVPGDPRGWPSGAPADGVWRGCWAWSLMLQDGNDPGLVDVSMVIHQPADDGIICAGQAAYTVDLGAPWEQESADLCVEHTAQIRALPHGGVEHIHQIAARSA